MDQVISFKLNPNHKQYSKFFIFLHFVNSVLLFIFNHFFSYLSKIKIEVYINNSKKFLILCHHYFFRKDKFVLNIFYSPNKISFFICKFQFKKWFLKALDVLKAIISNRTTSFFAFWKISALNYSFKWIISSFCKQFRFFFSIKASDNRDKLWNFS